MISSLTQTKTKMIASPVGVGALDDPFDRILPKMYHFDTS